MNAALTRVRRHFPETCSPAWFNFFTVQRSRYFRVQAQPGHIQYRDAPVTAADQTVLLKTADDLVRGGQLDAGDRGQLLPGQRDAQIPARANPGAVGLVKINKHPGHANARRAAVLDPPAVRPPPPPAAHP